MTANAFVDLQLAREAPRWRAETKTNASRHFCLSAATDARRRVEVERLINPFPLSILLWNIRIPEGSCVCGKHRPVPDGPRNCLRNCDAGENRSFSLALSRALSLSPLSRESAVSFWCVGHIRSSPDFWRCRAQAWRIECHRTERSYPFPDVKTSSASIRRVRAGKSRRFARGVR